MNEKVSDALCFPNELEHGSKSAENNMNVFIARLIEGTEKCRKSFRCQELLDVIEVLSARASGWLDESRKKTIVLRHDFQDAATEVGSHDIPVFVSFASFRTCLKPVEMVRLLHLDVDSFKLSASG